MNILHSQKITAFQLFENEQLLYICDCVFVKSTTMSQTFTSVASRSCGCRKL